MPLFSLSDADASRLARIERKLDLIINHLAIEPPADDGLNEVRALVRQGPQHKIAAISLYRKLTGAGLAEAKRAVENGF